MEILYANCLWNEVMIACKLLPNSPVVAIGVVVISSGEQHAGPPCSFCTKGTIKIRFILQGYPLLKRETTTADDTTPTNEERNNRIARRPNYALKTWN